MSIRVRTCERYFYTAVFTGLLDHTSPCQAATITEMQSFDLHAGKAADRLNEFIEQAHVQVLYDSDELKSLRTHAVNGRFTPTVALDRMFKGTGITYIAENSMTLSICLARNPYCVISTHKPLIHERPSRQFTSSSTEPPSVSPRVIQVFGQRDIGQISVGPSQFEQTGAFAPLDALQTLPLVIFGGVTDGNIPVGREAQTNNVNSTGINIRGLGAGSTLVLFDGHRALGGGTQLMYFDWANLQQEAIKNFEAKPDGASLGYGADTIGRVVNIVLNRDVATPMAATDIQGAGIGDARHDLRIAHIQSWKIDDDTGLKVAIEYRQQGTLEANERSPYTNNLAPFGGSDFRSSFGQPATLLAGSTFYAVPHNEGPAPLVPGNFVPNTRNLTDTLAGTDIYPRQRLFSAYGVLQRKFGENVNATVDSLCSQRRTLDNSGSYSAEISINPGYPYYVNPTGGTGTVDVLFDFGRDIGQMIEKGNVVKCDSTLEFKLTRGEWHVDGSFGYAFQNLHQITNGLVDFTALTGYLDGSNTPGFNLLGDGSNSPGTSVVNAIRSSSRYSANAHQFDVSLAADRPVFSLPAGMAALETGFEFRTETLDSETIASNSTPPATLDLSRGVISVFGAIGIPLAKRLDLSVAGRFDDYTDFGSVLSPQYALTWMPFKELSFRATWAKLFRPPNMSQLIATDNVSQLYPLPDSRSASGTTTALIETGGNPQLRPERSRNWSFTAATGSEEPDESGQPRTSAQLSYYHIDTLGRIDDLPLTLDVLDDPEYSSRINRNPTPAQRQAICNHGLFEGSTADCLTAPVGAIVNLLTDNLSVLTTSGIELEAHSSFNAFGGRLLGGLKANYVFDFSEAATTAVRKIQLLNTPNNPIDFHMRPELQWAHAGFTIFTALNFANSYRDNVSIPNRNVASWTTLDMQVSYIIDTQSTSPFAGTKFSLAARNLFNRQPPFVNNASGVGFDLLNANLEGRVISLTVSRKWY
jgi:iron complex outermembrane recepter protein